MRPVRNRRSPRRRKRNCAGWRSETMDIAELPIEILKQRARSGDHRALQALRDSGFFRSRGAAAEGEPVSPAQQRLWVAARQSPDGDAFVIVRALRLLGPLR